MRQITLEEAEYIAHRLVREMMNYSEPLGDFSTRHPHKLESCLAQPLIAFRRRDPYPTLLDKSAVLFF